MWRHILGAALLGGIGFTVALFITGLAFSDSELIAQAKLGILIGSIAAGVGAWFILRGCPADESSDDQDDEEATIAVESVGAPSD